MTSPSAANLPADRALPARGSPWYLAGICLVASLGGFLFGFDTAVISGTVEMVEEQFDLSKFQVGWFGSSALVGCIVGAAFVGVLSDRFGRKPNLIVASVFLFVSALYSAIPPNFDVLTWARLLGGLGVGMASVLAPMYISEFSPPKWRGRLVTVYQLSIVLGILAAYFSNWALLQFSQGEGWARARITGELTGVFGAVGCGAASSAHFGAASLLEAQKYGLSMCDFPGGQGWLHWTLVAEVWRGMFGAEMIPAVGFFFLLFLVPESPRWLAKAGRYDEALAVLTRVDGADLAQREMAEIQQSIREETGTVAELFRPGLRMALIVAVGLSVFGQCTGVNIVVYYGPIVLKGAGFESASALQWQVVLGIMNLIFTFVAIWKVDAWGRRPLLVWGMAAVTLSLATAASFLLLQAPAGWVVAVLCAYMGFVAVSICGVIWVLSPEIFPNRVRGRAMSIATFSNWTTNMISVFLFPWYVDRCGIHTGFFTFAAICAVATAFFWRYVPETKGKTLEEIARHWGT